MKQLFLAVNSVNQTDMRHFSNSKLGLFAGKLLKASFSFHKRISKNAQMTTLFVIVHHFHHDLLY